MKTPHLPALALPLALLIAPGALAQEGPAASSPPPDVIATVNGESVYVEDLERLLGDLHGEASDGDRRAPDLDRAMFRESVGLVLPVRALL